MFGIKRKAQENALIKEIQELDTHQRDLSREVRYLRSAIETLKITVDEGVKLAMDDIQKRYIKSLEDKLVRFDDEVTTLKIEQKSDRERLHGYYTRKT